MHLGCCSIFGKRATNNKMPFFICRCKNRKALGSSNSFRKDMISANVPPFSRIGEGCKKAAVTRYHHSSPKIGVESFILMIEHILVSILFDLTRATLLSLRNTLTLL